MSFPPTAFRVDRAVPAAGFMRARAALILVKACSTDVITALQRPDSQRLFRVFKDGAEVPRTGDALRPSPHLPRRTP